MLAIVIDVREKVIKQSFNFLHDFIFVAGVTEFVVQNNPHKYLISIFTIYGFSEFIDVAGVAESPHWIIYAIQQIKRILPFIYLVVSCNSFNKIIMKV